MTTSGSAGARLRELLKRGPVAAPGAFNGLVGKAVAAAGFDAAYVSGGALSAAAGVPDVGVLSLDHFARVIREVALASGLPLIADADTGFGEEEMVRRTVVTYAHAGAAALHIEDQVFPKRCGHLDGKTLLPVEQAADKVAWARRAARDFGDGAFLICARTDAAGVDGLDAAVERAKAYVEAGAEMIFPEGLKSEADFGRFAEAMKKPVAGAPGLKGRGPYLLANMTEFGKTPMVPLERFGELGYDVVIYPVSTLRLTLGAIVPALKELRETGTLEGQLGNMQDRDGLYAMLGYTPGTAWEAPAR
ncbi:MAG: isocitrate lyase/phosphoenolpyruvate mutase family protein [Phycisphaerales bacterium]